MALSVKCALLQIAKLSTKLASDDPFRIKFVAIIGDTQTSTNKRVLQMRALLRSAGIKSPSRVRILNDLGETPKTIISYNAVDPLSQSGLTTSFTYQLNPGP